MKKANRTAYRFLYHPISYPEGVFIPVFELTGYHSKETCERLITLWNKRDRASRTWRYEESLDCDIDYPENVRRRKLSQQAASRYAEPTTAQ
jgi:hypothetical protein